ncbi:MAG: chorismate mutase [Deinococcales bacterium]
MEKPYWLRGIRGATTVKADEAFLVLEATAELLQEVLKANQIDDYDCIAAIFFSTTPDITSTFPAEAARQLGMTTVPLMCHQEIAVPNRLPLAIRLMMQINTQKSQQEIKHIYLRDAVKLRPDLVSAQ